MSCSTLFASPTVSYRQLLIDGSFLQTLQRLAPWGVPSLAQPDTCYWKPFTRWWYCWIIPSDYLPLAPAVFTITLLAYKPRGIDSMYVATVNITVRYLDRGYLTESHLSTQHVTGPTDHVCQHDCAPFLIWLRNPHKHYFHRSKWRKSRLISLNNEVLNIASRRP